MKITGYALREAIKRWTLRRDAAVAQFEGTLKKFDDEEKDTPVEVMARLTEAELRIARLQTAQAQYNLSVNVHVSVPGIIEKEMNLCMAVKLIGGVGRQEKLWRNIAAPGKDPYGSRMGEISRDKDTVFAKSTVSQKDAAVLAEGKARISSALVTAIAKANAVEIDIGFLSTADLED